MVYLMFKWTYKTLEVEMLSQNVNENYVDYISRFHQLYNINGSKITYSVMEFTAALVKSLAIL